MITLMPLFIFFTVGAVAGAIQVRRLIMNGRQAMQNLGNYYYAWSEMPLSSWRYEPEASMSMTVHILTMLGLGLLALSAVWNGGILSYPLFANDKTMAALVWFVEYGSILVAGYQLGAALINFPLVLFRKTPVSLAITVSGMAYGRHLLPWSWFSHFAIERSKSTLKLYSAFAPDLASMIMELPASIPLQELEEVMQQLMPAHPVGGRAWYQTKSMFLPTMILACLLFAAAGWLVSDLSRELALFSFALIITLLGFVGGRVVRLFAFGRGAIGG